jgi:hypothetical protein
MRAGNRPKDHTIRVCESDGASPIVREQVGLRRIGVGFRFRLAERAGVPTGLGASLDQVGGNERIGRGPEAGGFTGTKSHRDPESRGSGEEQYHQEACNDFRASRCSRAGVFAWSVRNTVALRGRHGR